MSNNNNLITEISALVLAVLLVLAGALLLYVGKIGYDSAIFFFISALGLFGFQSAWKAPSPSQQSQLLSLVAEKQAQPPVVIHNNIPALTQTDLPLPAASLATQATDAAIQEVQNSLAQLTISHSALKAVVQDVLTQRATPASPLSAPAPQAVPQPQFVPAPFPYQPGSTYPNMPAVQP